MADLPLRRNKAVLWVNDRPDEYLANSDSAPHGHSYGAGRTMPIAVSFEALDGTAVRVNFDLETGDITTQDITEYQR